MDIHYNGEPLNPIGPIFIVVKGQPPIIKEACPPCDRCHNKLPWHRKILPVRPETLCDNCKKIVGLIDYITAED